MSVILAMQKKKKIVSNKQTKKGLKNERTGKKLELKESEDSRQISVIIT